MKSRRSSAAEDGGRQRRVSEQGFILGAVLILTLVLRTGPMGTAWLQTPRFSPRCRATALGEATGDQNIFTK